MFQNFSMRAFIKLCNILNVLKISNASEKILFNTALSAQLQFV